jgi:arginase
MSNQPIHLIGACSSWGSGYDGPDLAPPRLKDFGLADQLSGATGRPDIKWRGMLRHDVSANGEIITPDVGYEHVLSLSKKLAKIVRRSIFKKDAFPIIIGGDHATAFGTWAGVAGGMAAHSSLGLLWFDAHLDCHTATTANQGKWGGQWHGRPVAHLVDDDGADYDLAHILSHERVIDPAHLVIFGVRSFEPGEADLVERHDIRVFYMKEIINRGVADCLDEATGIVNSAPDGFGISLDLDMFDPGDFAAVGTPEEDGVSYDVFLQAMEKMKLADTLKGLEIVEYNPLKSINARSDMARIVKLISTILT